MIFQYLDHNFCPDFVEIIDDWYGYGHFLMLENFQGFGQVSFWNCGRSVKDAKVCQGTLRYGWYLGI